MQRCQVAYANQRGLLKPPMLIAMASVGSLMRRDVRFTDAQIQSASGTRDALLAGTWVRFAPTDFMCK